MAYFNDNWLPASMQELRRVLDRVLAVNQQTLVDVQRSMNTPGP
jgi:hypothetical protein